MKGLSLLVWKLWPRLKVFVHATDADGDADGDGRAVTLAPGHICPGSLKIQKFALTF